MPSDEMVEKVQTLDDAIDNALIAWGMGWDMDGVMACLKEAKDRAALSAASGPVVSHARPMFGQGSYIADALTKNIPPCVCRLGSASPSEAAIRADERAAIRKEAFEEAAKIARIEAAQCASLGCTHPENSETRDRLFARARAADAIATAIRARGER